MSQRLSRSALLQPLRHFHRRVGDQDVRSRPAHRKQAFQRISVLLISFVLFTGAANATSTSLFVKSSSKSEVFTIHYKTTEKSTVRLSILNDKNQLVFTETFFNSASFVRPYNFSELAEGEYTIVLADKNGKQAEKVNHLASTITSHISVAEIVNQENKYRLDVTNSGTDVVSVRIYAQDGTPLHEQLVTVTGSFSTIYNLSQVKSAVNSAITFEVTTSNGQIRTIQF